jgi:thioredoxin-dependent peroxiredoxin
MSSIFKGLLGRGVFTPTSLLASGTAAPDFSAPDQSERQVTLASLRGKWFVLYFYPQAHTPGCIREACEFRDHQAEFDAAGAVVVGVSFDPVSSQASFSKKYGATFPLLSDPDHAIATAYGVGSILGRDFRVSFLVDPVGVIRKVWPSVSPSRHATEVLEAIRSFSS